MIGNFANRVAKEIWEKVTSKALPAELHLRAKYLLEIMYSTHSLDELEKKGRPPALNMHHLHGNRRGERAIDITRTSGWRITFRFESGKFVDVKIENYHK